MVAVHEETEVSDLLTYAEQTGQKPVKLFMLVIARYITHAAVLLGMIEGLLYGRYKGKVIQVDSSKNRRGRRRNDALLLVDELHRAN